MQVHFHYRLLRSEPAAAVKFEGGGIAAPHIQGETVTAIVRGEVSDSLEKGFSNSLAAEFPVNAEVVDIEGPVIVEDVVVTDFPEYAESVAHHGAGVIHCSEYGCLFIVQNSRQLVSGIFFRTCLEEVRTAFMVYHAYLIQKVVYPVHVFFLCPADFHVLCG